MRNLIFISLPFVSIAVFAQGPALVTVQDTLYAPNGSTLSGTVYVTNPTTFTSPDGKPVPAFSNIATTVTNGVLSVALVPNVGATPIGTFYKVRYALTNGVSNETWVVPASGPVNLAVVRTNSAPNPNQVFQFTQILPPSPCSSANVVSWTSPSWFCVPGIAVVNAADRGLLWLPTVEEPAAIAVTGVVAAADSSQGYAQMVTIPFDITVGRVTVYLVANVNTATCDVGLYDMTQHLLVSVGGFTATGLVANLISKTVSVTHLPPGNYWYAQTCNDTTVQFAAVLRTDAMTQLMQNKNSGPSCIPAKDVQFHFTNHSGLNGVLPTVMGDVGCASPLQTLQLNFESPIVSIWER